MCVVCNWILCKLGILYVVWTFILLMEQICISPKHQPSTAQMLDLNTCPFTRCYTAMFKPYLSISLTSKSQPKTQKPHINFKQCTLLLLPVSWCRYGYMCTPGPWLGTSSYWKDVILRPMSVWGTASTNRAPCARLKQCTEPWGCCSSARSSLMSPARSK